MKAIDEPIIAASNMSLETHYGFYYGRPKDSPRLSTYAAAVAASLLALPKAPLGLPRPRLKTLASGGLAMRTFLITGLLWPWEPTGSMGRALAFATSLGFLGIPFWPTLSARSNARSSSSSWSGRSGFMPFFFTLLRYTSVLSASSNVGRIGSWLGYRAVEVEAALALALALGLGVPLEYLIVSVLASLFLGRPLTRGASGSGSGGGKLGIIASGEAMPVVHGTLEVALGGALGAAVTLVRLGLGGGVPMSC